MFFLLNHGIRNHSYQCLDFSDIECEVIDGIILDIAKLDETYPNSLFLVCGDMNGRMGNLADFVDYDTCAKLPLPDFHTEGSFVFTRGNEDTVVNAQGKRIIEFCKMTNLRIANGKLGVDKNIGKFTHIQWDKYHWLLPVFCSIVWSVLRI